MDDINTTSDSVFQRTQNIQSPLFYLSLGLLPVGPAAWEYLTLELNGYFEGSGGEIRPMKDFSLDLPKFYLDEVLPEYTEKAWERPILEAIHESCFIGAFEQEGGNMVGQTIFDGVEISKIQIQYFLPKLCFLFLGTPFLIQKSLR